MSYHSFIVQGNLTRDAEVRQVGQSSVASFGLATSRRFKKQDGTDGEETEFHDIELWNNNGVYPYLTKGQSVLIQGEIRTDRWQDQNGQQREKKKIRASVIQLCGSRQQQGAQQQPPMGPPQPQYQQPQAPMQQPPQYQQPPQQQYRQAPQPPMQPQYQQPQPPAQPQYQQPQPPAQPQYPQPGQPGNPQYPPMNSPAYTQPQDDDLPPGF